MVTNNPSNNSVALVMEGGGMRGAYTAGVLSVFLEKQVRFDYGVGISAGAVNLCAYWMKRADYLHQIMVEYMSDKKNVGVSPLLREGTFVGYNYMFDYLLPQEVKFDLTQLSNTDAPFEFGNYNLDLNRNDWIQKEDVTFKDLKASCSLPIAGKPVKTRGYLYMDGGITTMVPIERSIAHGCKKHFVIITKDKEYVRNPEPAVELNTISLMFRKYPQLRKRLEVRHRVYYQEMGLIEKMVEEGTAYLVRPSEKVPVSRFKGDPVGLQKCFDLGVKDARDQWDQIKTFLGEDHIG